MSPDTPRDESRIDLTLSWDLFRKNAKPFLATQLVAVGGAIGIAVLIAAILGAFTDARDYLVVVLQLPAFLVFLAFQGSLYGLAFDIMSSGDQFAEVRGSFRYLGRFWGRYLLFGFVLNLPTYPVVIFGVLAGDYMIAHVFEVFCIFAPASFAWFLLFVQAGPMLTAQEKIAPSFRGSLRAVRESPRRHLKTWGQFWVAFYLPQFATDLLTISLLPGIIAGDFAFAPLLVLAVVAEVWYYFAGVPMQTLVATRIYNSHLPSHSPQTSGT